MNDVRPYLTCGMVGHEIEQIASGARCSRCGCIWIQRSAIIDDHKPERVVPWHTIVLLILLFAIGIFCFVKGVTA